MDPIEQEEKGGTKRLIIPVLLILFCFVGAIGTGYAVSSTVDNGGNTLSGDFVSIDIYKDSSASTVLNSSMFTDADIITFVTDRYTSDEAYAVRAVGVDGKTVTTKYVMITAEGVSGALNTTFKVTADTSLEYLSGYILELTSTSDPSDAYAISLDLGAGTVATGSAPLRVNTVYEMNIKVDLVDGYATADGKILPGTYTLEQAKALVDALNGAKYSFTFSVESA